MWNPIILPRRYQECCLPSDNRSWIPKCAIVSSRVYNFLYLSYPVYVQSCGIAKQVHWIREGGDWSENPIRLKIDCRWQRRWCCCPGASVHGCIRRIMNRFSFGGNRFSRMWTTAVLNAITNRASSASKNLSVRYSSIPNNDGGGGGGAPSSTSNLSKIMGGSGIILPLDVEETVTCFCRLVKSELLILYPELTMKSKGRAMRR